VRTVDEERAPVERDVHDGAQQRLVILGGGLRHAEQGTASDDPRHRLHFTSSAGPWKISKRWHTTCDRRSACRAAGGAGRLQRAVSDPVDLSVAVVGLPGTVEAGRAADLFTRTGLPDTRSSGRPL
jgi:hypothetical protein